MAQPLTNAQLIREINKKGDIEMPVLSGNNVVHLIIRKKDLVDNILVELPQDAIAEWQFVETAGSVRRLDVA